MNTKSETSRICVFSPAFYPNPEKIAGIERLKYSAEKFGIHVNFIGLGEQWRGFYQCKIIAVRDFLNEHVVGKYDYSLMVDASDCMFQQPLDNLIERYEEDEGDVIIASEQNLFPRWLRQCYLNTIGKDSFKSMSRAFPNSGCILSTPEKHLEALNIIIDTRNDPQKAKEFREYDKKHPTLIYEDKFEEDKVVPGTDQALWGVATIYQLTNIQTDVAQRYFCCFAGYQNGDVSLKDGKITHTENVPTVLHFNSKSNRYFSIPIARWLFPEKYGKPKSKELCWFSFEDDIETLRVIIIRNASGAYKHEFLRLGELQYNKKLKGVDKRIGETGVLDVTYTKERTVYLLRGEEVTTPLQYVIDRFERPLKINTVIIYDEVGDYQCSLKNQIIIDPHNKDKDSLDLIQQHSEEAEEILKILERIHYDRL